MFLISNEFFIVKMLMIDVWNEFNKMHLSTLINCVEYLNCLRYECSYPKLSNTQDANI